MDSIDGWLMDDDDDEQVMMPWRDDAAASVRLCVCDLRNFSE